MRTKFILITVITRMCTFARSSSGPGPVGSPAVERGGRPDDHVINDNGGRFSDGRYLGTHRVDRGAFYAGSPGPLLPHGHQKQKSHPWVVLAFASAVVNTDREGLG